MGNGWTRRTTAALAAGLALVVAGCGGTAQKASSVVAGPTGTVPTASAGSVRAAAGATADAHTSKLTLSVAYAGVPALGDGTVSMHGVIDRDARRASMTVDAGVIPGVSGATTVVVDGTTAYLSGPLVGFLGIDKPWAKLDATHLGDAAGAAGGLAADAPHSFLELLAQVGTVETVGTEQIDGVDTTHVRGRIDPAKAVGRLPADVRSRLDATLSRFAVTLADLPKVTVDAWIDHDGHVRKVVVPFDLSTLPGKAAIDGASVTVTVEMSALGEPVTITVPDPSEVGTIDVSKFGGWSRFGGN